MKQVFVVLDINLKVMEDTVLRKVYNNLEDAMKESLEIVLNHDGKNIKAHGFELEGVEYSPNRISNNTSLGSEYGITYNSKYGNYPCCLMIIPRTIN
jgi:hypothetical protein